MEDQKVSLTGRVYNIRGAGAKLLFIDIQEDSSKVQVFANAQFY